MIRGTVLRDYLNELDQDKFIILRNKDEDLLVDSIKIKDAGNNDFIKTRLHGEVGAMRNYRDEVVIILNDKSLKEVLLSLAPTMQVYVMDTDRHQTNHPLTSKRALTDEFCFRRLDGKVIQLDKNEKITTIIVQYEQPNLW